jgi:hypothetical protein
MVWQKKMICFCANFSFFGSGHHGWIETTGYRFIRALFVLGPIITGLSTNQIPVKDWQVPSCFQERRQKKH